MLSISLIAKPCKKLCSYSVMKESNVWSRWALLLYTVHLIVAFIIPLSFHLRNYSMALFSFFHFKSAIFAPSKWCLCAIFMPFLCPQFSFFRPIRNPLAPPTSQPLLGQFPLMLFRPLANDQALFKKIFSFSLYC